MNRDGYTAYWTRIDCLKPTEHETCSVIRKCHRRLDLINKRCWENWVFEKKRSSTHTTLPNKFRVDYRIKCNKQYTHKFKKKKLEGTICLFFIFNVTVHLDYFSLRRGSNFRTMTMGASTHTNITMWLYKIQNEFFTLKIITIFKKTNEEHDKNNKGWKSFHV